MTQSSKLLVSFLLLCGAGAFFGFVVFATSVMRNPETPNNTLQADGIVVLTGGTQRIAKGIELLKMEHGKRLLISGVNPKTTKKDIFSISGLEPEKFECCVDLGYKARNTLGNAEEAANWAREKNFKSLIVVTSSYHMPRSLAVFSQMMPNIKLVAHPVVPSFFKNTRWWLNPEATQVILSEYLKYLPAAAHLVASRYLPLPNAQNGVYNAHAVSVPSRQNQ